MEQGNAVAFSEPQFCKSIGNAVGDVVEPAIGDGSPGFKVA